MTKPNHRKKNGSEGKSGAQGRGEFETTLIRLMKMRLQTPHSSRIAELLREIKETVFNLGCKLMAAKLVPEFEIFLSREEKQRVKAMREDDDGEDV